MPIELKDYIGKSLNYGANTTVGSVMANSVSFGLVILIILFIMINFLDPRTYKYYFYASLVIIGLTFLHDSIFYERLKCKLEDKNTGNIIKDLKNIQVTGGDMLQPRSEVIDYTPAADPITDWEAKLDKIL